MSTAQKPGFDCCTTCGHRSAGAVCSVSDCECLCSLNRESGLPDVSGWQETALMAVVDLILDEKEGDVFIVTKKGTECRVKVRFVPELGFSMVKGGDS